MKHKLVIFLLATLVYSCNKCGNSIKIGQIKLAESSKEFIPYSSKETLTFIDNDGIKHELHSTSGRTLEESGMTVRTPCMEGILDTQNIFYETQRLQIAFFDSSENQIFYVDLMTQFEDSDDLDSIAIYDLLRVSSSLKGYYYGDIEIITEVRQNQVSDFHKNQFLTHSDFIGDTTIYGRLFTDVYEANSSEGKSIFYSKSKGVLALKSSTDEYWVLNQ